MKTPLIAIGGFVRQVRRKVAEDDNLARKLDLAIEQVQQLEMLVGDTLAFAKPLKLQYRQDKINYLIEEVVTLVGEKASKQYAVTIETELQEEMPVVEYDRHRLQQALLNLLDNALEASPRGEKIVVRAQAEGSNIIIEVIDRGQGIAPEHLADIFTPFVTTKKEGTGLGLPIVKKVIEAHEGSIKISNNIEKGVTFRINIPLVRNPEVVHPDETEEKRKAAL
jgi:signal transduction histidine kinase